MRARTVLTTTFVLVAWLAAAAQASASAAFSITPASRGPYFTLALTPGASSAQVARVVNVGDTSGTVRLTPVDATSGQTSGAVYLSPSAPRRDVGRWISLAPSTLTLAAHQSALVRFTVRVPSQAGPGQHLGGLVAAPVTPTSTRVTRRGRNTFQINVHEISVVAVEINLPGPNAGRLALAGVAAGGRPGYQTILVGIANPSTKLIRGSGRVQIRDSAGRTVLAQRFTLDTLVPHTSIRYPVYVHGRRLGTGRYSVRVAVAYGRGQTLAKTFPLTVGAVQLRQTYGSTVPASLAGPAGRASTPVWIFVIGGVAILLLSLGGSALYFRRRYANSTGP